MSNKEKLEKPIHLRQLSPCPICKKVSVQKYHPFCSSHCANVDLGRWLNGVYTVPSQREENADIDPE